jgi:hypothetical protein
MPTTDELARFIAHCNAGRYGRDRWQQAVRAAAHRMLNTAHDSERLPEQPANPTT